MYKTLEAIKHYIDEETMGGNIEHIMKEHLNSRLPWQIGSFVFSGLALFFFAAAVFLFVSDDFVIQGKVVPASDMMFVYWRVSLCVLVVCCVVFAWLCHWRRRTET